MNKPAPLGNKRQLRKRLRHFEGMTIDVPNYDPQKV